MPRMPNMPIAYLVRLDELMIMIIMTSGWGLQQRPTSPITKNIASEKVIIQLILSKCIPIPMSNGLEACPLKKSDSKSLDFVVDFS